jgi:hypothetical protein
MILLVMVFYLFAIMAIMYFKGNDVLHFENLEVAMISLFRIATMEVCPSRSRALILHLINRSLS